MFKTLKEDIEVIFEQDPAARSYLEVILTYSGLHAIWAHRIAHALYKRKFYFLARLISQISRFLPALKFTRGQNWSPLFHRSRHGSCHRGNV